MKSTLYGFVILSLITMGCNTLTAKPEVETVLKGLTNPSSVSFSPKGELTVCDASGKVIVVKDGKPTDYITGFDTEHWKSDDTGAKWYKLGPLSAVWAGETLVVTDAGKGDGKETLLFFDGPGKASDGKASNSIPPTSDDAKDKGEGNLTGMVATKNGKRVFVCGQGFDGKSWVLAANVKNKKLTTLFSADDNGIATNSPMQAIMGNKGKVLVLYSGKGGAEDGLLVEWDPKTKKPTNQWKLPGLINPMGIARIARNRFAVVENNWNLKKVNEGKVAIVTLKKDKAVVKDTGVRLHGPVSCAFGPDNKLYVAQLGKEYDKTAGSVVAISGLKKAKKPGGGSKKKKKDSDKAE